MTQEVRFDPLVIKEFARRLYQRAATIVWTHTLVGFVVGFGALVAIGNAIFDDPVGLGVGGVGALLGGVAGILIGQEKAFALKLQAQTALCQVYVESHARDLREVVMRITTASPDLRVFPQSTG